MAPKRKATNTKADSWRLDELLTSQESKLIDVDLHGKLAGFFSDPENWAQVSDGDKEYIRSLLPPNVELNDDGSIPLEFWRYNSEFRLNCRNLQEDLRAGRMDPEWQRQALQAMEERAEGQFDDYKEREFEAFWGQKQKVDYSVLAGHASKVRLEDMLKAALFKEGDVWSFDHTFGRGNNAVRIHKDCKIVKIEGMKITVAIPPGTRRFARRLEEAGPPQQDTDVSESQPAEEVGSEAQPSLAVDSKSREESEPVHATTSESPTAPSTPHNGRNPVSPASARKDHLLESTEYDVILFETIGLQGFEKQILKIDGRAKPGSRTSSVWRDVRCFRNEQDIGSLFEMREEYYVYHVAKGD
ncbi:MAG: hypothetical protein LQ352_007722 [Teloschistes flavicans]|nr:MAG: hypothetical protein LQ352_007722 [Teloschistes flavicans]